MRYGVDRTWYDTRQVCINGHEITSMANSHPEYTKKRCPECGSETITTCPSCKSMIQGYHHVPGVIGFFDSELPAHCHECGEPYPWTLKSDTPKPGATPESKPASDVFIVHGHDEEMKQAAARVLSRLKLNPVILHEQPNEGRTLIEKFEKNSDVQFAIVLLSPDDLAYVAKSDPKTAHHRARQNVVLELGYFVGRLGRSRVFALKRDGDLELPSDLSGIVYTSYDVGGKWQFELARELKAAGYSIDANSIL